MKDGDLKDAKYCHIFNGDFDYGRWENKQTRPTKRESNTAYRKRQLDYKRKHG